MANFLDLEIISPEKKVYNGKVKSVTVPGSRGNFQILFNHAPLISSLEIGIIRVDTEADSSHFFTTSGGSVEVLENHILILSDTVEPVEKIDLERAEKAKERAEARLTGKTNIVDVDRARASMARAMNRIQAYDKYLTK